MAIELVVVVRQVAYESDGSTLALTSVDLIYPDGRDCGVPLLVENHEDASELLAKLGVTSQELEEFRAKFQRDAEFRIPLMVDETVVKGMGFDPREHQSRES